MNNTQIPLTTEKPNPAAWANIGFAPDSSVLLKHRETGELLRYRMEPKPILACAPINDAFIESGLYPKLKRLMLDALEKRELAPWAKRAGVDYSWCHKFLRGDIKRPRAVQVQKMLDSRFVDDSEPQEAA